MTPELALQSPIFLAYAGITAGVLLAAGLILAGIRFGLRRDVSSPLRTYRSWVILAPGMLAVILVGREATIVVFAGIALLGFKEFARATGLYRDWWMTGAAYLGIIAVGITTLVHDPNDGEPGWYGLFMSLPIYVIGLLLVIPILRNRVRGQLQAISLAILGFIYIGWMFGHLAFLANSEHAYGYLLYLLFAVATCDVAAFICGRLFGRHPLRSEISPGKTVEGALGALAVGMLLPWALHFSFPHFGTTALVLTGLIVGVGGQLGDLSISVIKRDLGIKDMGGLIPGHGGVLDRIDSLIFTAPLMLHMVDYLYKHW